MNSQPQESTSSKMKMGFSLTPPNLNPRQGLVNHHLWLLRSQQVYQMTRNCVIDHSSLWGSWTRWGWSRCSCLINWWKERRLSMRGNHYSGQCQVLWYSSMILRGHWRRRKRWSKRWTRQRQWIKWGHSSSLRWTWRRSMKRWWTRERYPSHRKI